MFCRALLTATTRWAIPPRMAISLASAGFEVSAVCLDNGSPLQKTRAVRRTFAYSGLRPLASLIDAIEASDPQVLIPCDDRATAHLHELHAYALGLGVSGQTTVKLVESSLGRPDSYPIVSSRPSLLELARQLGLRVPATKLISSLEDLRSWGREYRFPWVLKADGTFSGAGVRVARTFREAEEAFEELSGMFSIARALTRHAVDRDPFWLRPALARWRPKVIVQSHIEGSPANCAALCASGEILAGISVDVVSTQGPNRPASVVRLVDRPSMMDAAQKIARRLGLSGFFGLDFMKDLHGDDHLIELNPRCTPQCHLRLKNGRDMSGALWQDLTGNANRVLPERLGLQRQTAGSEFPGCAVGRTRVNSGTTGIPSRFFPSPDQPVWTC